MALDESLRILKKAGFIVPRTLEDYALDQDYRNRGVECVWECKCGHVYEHLIPGLISFDHACGKGSKQIWSRSDGFA